MFTPAGDILTVDDDGDEDYLKIQDAIDNASEGDTIHVFSGMYKESIILDKQLLVKGIKENNEGIPVINGCGSSYVITINADSCQFQGFKVVNSSKSGFTFAGIKIASDNNFITNNIISNNSNGIFLDKSCKNIIRMNGINNHTEIAGLDESGHGIYLVESSNNTIDGNKFLKNDWDQSLTDVA